MASRIGRTVLLVITSVAMVFPALAKDANSTKPVKKATVALKDAKGQSVGSATIKSSGKGVEVKLDVKDLPPGVHALHFHQNAQVRSARLQDRRRAFQS